tara:strand:- start:1788 stop:2306 length:519 start_codon:yes stop_codon:yes gene_type:complete
MDLNIKLISQNNLSPDEYVFLYLLHKGAAHLTSKMRLNIDTEYLFNEGWIQEEADRVTVKYTSLFVSDMDQMFAELIANYPNRVKTRTGEIRVLCAKDPKATTNTKAKNRYAKIVAKKPHLHVYIIKCLENQLKVVDHAYMQNLETWLNNYTWERYEEIDGNGEETRIARKL